MVCRNMSLFFPKLEVFFFLTGIRIRKALLVCPSGQAGVKK